MHDKKNVDKCTFVAALFSCYKYMYKAEIIVAICWTQSCQLRIEHFSLGLGKLTTNHMTNGKKN